jgi:type VI secretion system secreted protein VgrG
MRKPGGIAMDLTSFDGLPALFARIKALTQSQRSLRLRILIQRKDVVDNIDDVLLVQSCDVTERLNDGIRGTITCLSIVDDLPLGHFAGIAVELQIASDSGRPRLIRCLIDKIIRGFSDGGLTVYQIHVIDPLNFLRHRQRDTRIVTDATLIAASDELLRQLQTDSPSFGGLFTWTWLLDRTRYPQRGFWMQKSECVTAFLFRQWKRYGVSWFLRPHAGSDRIEIVLFDDPAQLSENPAGEVRVHPRNDGSHEHDSILLFSDVHQIAPNVLQRVAFDYKPTMLLEVQSRSDAPQSQWSREIGAALRDAAIDAPHLGDDMAEFQRLADVRMGRCDFDRAYALGVSTAPALEIGLTTPIANLAGRENAPLEDCRHDFTLLRHLSDSNIREIAEQLSALLAQCERLDGWEPTPRLDWRGEGSDSRHMYLASFIAVKHGTPVPPRWDPDEDLPPMHPMTAIVGGDDGEFVNIDELGRLQVSIPGERSERLSARIRVATSYAHDGAGALFPYPVGSECRIAFENGDEAKPVIEHVYFGGRHRPPQFNDGGGLPGNRLLAGIHLHEAGTCNFGELMWDLTPNQISMQLGSHYADTRLWLGNLYGRRFNGEGKPMGQGFYMHTLASGTVRTGRSLLLSAWGRSQDDGPQLDSPEHQDQLRRGQERQRRMGEYASRHQGLPSDDKPQAALLDDIQAAQGGSNTDPHGTGGKPTVSITAPEGVAASTPKAIVHSAGTNIDAVAGLNMQLVSGERTVINAGKGFSMFAHADGIRCIAHQGRLLLQSQHGDTRMEASGDITIASAGVLRLQAKEVLIQTEDGTYLRLADASPTIGGSGPINVRTGGHNWSGPSTLPARLPRFGDPTPIKLCVQCLLNAAAAGSPISTK